MLKTCITLEERLNQKDLDIQKDAHLVAVYKNQADLEHQERLRLLDLWNGGPKEVRKHLRELEHEHQHDREHAPTR